MSLPDGISHEVADHDDGDRKGGLSGALRWPSLTASVLLLAFAVYFVWDIVTLRRALHHADIFTYYYPFRQWFAAQIGHLHFPVWNPYWGIGHGAEVWASIPLDLYTPLELLVGPHYHWYQAAQLVLLLGVVAWIFHRLGTEPPLAVASAITFFMMPTVTYWFFSFLIAHVYVSHALLFFLVWEWSRTRDRRFLFLIAATTAASMLGTKVEFWFYQTIFFGFLAVLMGWLDTGRLAPTALRAAPVVLGLGVGILANLWQLNILVRLITESGRLSEHGPANLLRPHLYWHVLASIADSPLWQLTMVAACLYLIAAGPPRARVASIAALAAAGWLLWYSGAVNLGFTPVPGVPNASFERWVESSAGLRPVFFSFVENGAGCAVEPLAETDSVRDGRTAALLQGPRMGNCFLRTELTPADRFRGRRLRVTVWVRSDGVAADAIQADIQDGRGAPTLVAVSAGNGWRPVHIERQVAPDAPSVLVTLNVTDRARGPILVDGIEVQVARARPSWSRREYGLFDLLSAMARGPVLPGVLLGLALAVGLLRERAGLAVFRTVALFVPVLFYWCRPSPGELDETRILASAPWIFQVMVAALVWLGCRGVRSARLATTAWASLLFVLVMRDQGQIVLAWLAGILWLPGRDNYLIDFALALLAVQGLGDLARAGGPTLRQILAAALAATTAAVTVGSTWSDPYYSQPLMRPAPPGYPFYQGVPPLQDIVRDLRRSPTDRIYLANYDARGFTYGFAETLREGVGQVTMYSSLTSQRYKDWTIFHQLGIRPEQYWGGYPGGYSPATIERLPRKHTLGHSNETYYHYTIIARPPLRADLLDLLGVRHVLKLQPVVSDELVSSLGPGQLDREIAALSPSRLRPLDGIARPEVPADLYLAELAPAMPRAWVVHDVTSDVMTELQAELDPRPANGAINTRSYRRPIEPASVRRYEPELVTVDVETGRDGVLVLGDLFHPFWTAVLDGQPVEIFPVLHIFRGVRVPSGRHRVEFHCRVPYQPASVMVSLFVAVGTGGLWWWSNRRRKGA